jgi:tripeptidyl-peptidase-1
MTSIALLLIFVASAMSQGLPQLESMTQRKLWTQLGHSEPGTLVELTFMVKQTKVPELERVLLQVSDPKSNMYGQHWSNEDVHALIAPKKESIEAVMQHLSKHGVNGVAASPNSDMITADVTVELAEKLLNAKYFRFQHSETGHVAHRTLSYNLPDDVRQHVDFVSPTVRLPAVHRPTVSESSSADLTAPQNSSLNTPAVLRRLYSVGDEVGKKASKQAVTGFLEQFYKESDLKEFQALFWRKGLGDTMATKGDAPTGGVAGTESMLDAEYITALGTHVQSEFWGFSGRAPGSKQNEPFLKWLQTVSSTSDADVPKVFSTSYGEDEDSVSLDYATRINTEFMKAGARGISLLFASGDSGAAGDNHMCKNGKFVPQFPAASPYVTAVGGTSGGGLAPVGGETAAGIASGGFSNRWARPTWQDAAVKKYKQGPRVAALSSKFNATGRGFPDVAAQAMSFIVVQMGIPLPGVSGTSCASPTAAGIFGLLNDVRKQAGKPPLGFLNPFIYKNAAAFNDITKGGNTGCPSTAMQGFPAVAGWDAVTGVGTPNYEALKSVALDEHEVVV